MSDHGIRTQRFTVATPAKYLGIILGVDGHLRSWDESTLKVEGRARSIKSLFLGLKSIARFNIHGFSCLPHVGQFFFPSKSILSRLRERGQILTNAPRNALSTSMLQDLANIRGGTRSGI